MDGRDHVVPMEAAIDLLPIGELIAEQNKAQVQDDDDDIVVNGVGSFEVQN